jgi:hypothetical protein
MVTIVLDTILGIMVIGMAATMAGMVAPTPVTAGITQAPVMQVMVEAVRIVVLVALVVVGIVVLVALVVVGIVVLVALVVAVMLDIAEVEAILVARCYVSLGRCNLIWWAKGMNG